jgi:restriction system protein
MAEITGKRLGELLQQLFKILKDAPDGLRAGEALERLAKSIKLTPYEQDVYPSVGVQRFDKIVRFATIAVTKAGWLLKHKGTWSLTDAGRKALAEYPDPEEFRRQAYQLYQLWKATKKGESVEQPTGKSNTPEAPKEPRRVGGCDLRGCRRTGLGRDRAVSAVHAAM